MIEFVIAALPKNQVFDPKIMKEGFKKISKGESTFKPENL